MHGGHTRAQTFDCASQSPSRSLETAPPWDGKLRTYVSCGLTQRVFLTFARSLTCSLSRARALSFPGDESAYDDRMSLEHLCATCCAASGHPRRASDHSCEPAAASSALCRLQSLHWLLCRRWAQMEAPPQSTHLLLSRLCSQMEAPPQSLHWLLCRLCSQVEAPPQSESVLFMMIDGFYSQNGRGPKPQCSR